MWQYFVIQVYIVTLLPILVLFKLTKCNLILCFTQFWYFSFRIGEKNAMNAINNDIKLRYALTHILFLTWLALQTVVNYQKANNKQKTILRLRKILTKTQLFDSLQCFLRFWDVIKVSENYNFLGTITISTPKLNRSRFHKSLYWLYTDKNTSW